VLCELPYPSDDTQLITQAPWPAWSRCTGSGFAFSKVEVLLLVLCPLGEYTVNLHPETQQEESQKVMAVLDSEGAKCGWGWDALRSGFVPSTPGWIMRRDTSEFDHKS
jgi:DNA polymerase V